MRRENEKLIIDGNAIYELDLECVRKKQGKQEGNGRCVEQSEERRQSANQREREFALVIQIILSSKAFPPVPPADEQSIAAVAKAQLKEKRKFSLGRL